MEVKAGSLAPRMEEQAGSLRSRPEVGADPDQVARELPMRTIRTRFRLAVLFGLSLLVAGCVGVAVDDRASQPIPARLVKDMAARGMTPADPIMIRIYKKESELEVWKRNRSGRYALLKTYPMCRWSGKLGPKTQEGTGRRPRVSIA